MNIHIPDLGSIKESLILLYLDLISSDYYKNGNDFLSMLYLKWYSAGLFYNKKFFYIPFFTKNKMYKIPIILRPYNNVVKITDDKGDSLELYAGPGKDFFGIRLTPKDLGCKMIIISYDNGEEKIISGDEIIT
jgi:hypothetical protein